MLTTVLKTLRPKNIRTRLTLQTVSLIAVLFLLFSGFILFWSYGLMNLMLDREVEKGWGKKAALIHLNAEGRPTYELPYPIGSIPSLAWQFEVWTLEGERQFAMGYLGDITQPSPWTSIAKTNEPHLNTLVNNNGVRYRVKTGRVEIDGKPFVLRFGLDDATVYDRFFGLIAILVLGLLFVAGAAFPVAYWMVRRSLAPVDLIRRRAQKISATNLDQRLPVENPDDELGQLASTLNCMLARMQRALEENRRFASDASHELRTPLASIRSLAEGALVRDASKEELRDTLGRVLEGTRRLSSLTERLLTLTRMDAQSSLTVRPFDLAEQTRATVDQLEVLAQEKQQTIRVDLPNQLEAFGNKDLIGRAVMNLIDNGIKYTEPGGHIEVCAQEDGDKVRLQVRDDGPGIPACEHTKVFERFYRSDDHRCHKEGGFGVGLSIAHRAVELSLGAIELESEPGQGTTFTMVLPSSDPCGKHAEG